MAPLFASQIAAMVVLAAAAATIHFRGKVRLRFVRQLTDYSTFTAPFNVFVYLCSAVPNRPMLDAARFPKLDLLREHWETIRDEARALYEAGHIGKSDRHDDVYGNSLFKKGWRRFYLKWYGDALPSARRHCPETVALLERIPGLHAAMFTLVAPRSRLGRHRDPFATSLRYHLGLITPNSDRCRIFIDGEPYAWRDGEGVLFDETYVHWVENDTDAPRIILFCDVERPLHGRIPTMINRFVARRLAPHSAGRNVESEHLGALNRIVEWTYPIHLAGRRLKKRHRTVYYTLKFGLLGAALGAFLLAGR